MGRPSKYSPELVDAICARLADGEPLAQIVRDEAMPGKTTVWDWEQAHPGVSERIARARLDGYDAIAAQARLTARGAGDSAGDVQRDKLIVDTDLKLLAKWDPRRYGDRMTLSNDPEQPFGKASDEALEAKFQALLDKARGSADADSAG